MENNKKDWKCPICSSNSIALEPDDDHKHYNNQFREYLILIRCCDCQSIFEFKYKLNNITIHTIGKNEFKILTNEDIAKIIEQSGGELW